MTEGLENCAKFSFDSSYYFKQTSDPPCLSFLPSRLTRDIVDGFGPSGVEGTFRRCCEETMRVLRASRDDILTILEVLTHDPLYNWSMTPEKAFKIQGRWATEKNGSEVA